jgi:hypothetical protein
MLVKLCNGSFAGFFLPALSVYISKLSNTCHLALDRAQRKSMFFCHLAISLGSYLGVANKNLPPNILYPLTFRINCVGIITSVPTDYHIEDAQKN